MNDNYKTNTEDSILKEIGIDKSVSNFAEYWQIPYEEAKRLLRKEEFDLRKTIKENTKNILNAHMEALIKENKELKEKVNNILQLLHKIKNQIEYENMSKGNLQELIKTSQMPEMYYDILNIIKELENDK